MILTSIDHQRLSGLLPAYGQAVSIHTLAARVFDRVVALVPDGDLMRLSTDGDHHEQAVALCRRFGLGVIDIDPQDWYTWDGRNVATRMEPSVIIHEVAHYQCAAPHRRTIPDFGLGKGPETGLGGAGANAVATITGVYADVEEALSSLLGILWEAHLGQPAILALLEQNWLEGGADPRNTAHFIKVVETLHDLGLINDQGAPIMGLREVYDAPFFDDWFGA